MRMQKTFDVPHGSRKAPREMPAKVQGHALLLGVCGPYAVSPVTNLCVPFRARLWAVLDALWSGALSTMWRMHLTTLRWCAVAVAAGKVRTVRVQLGMKLLSCLSTFSSHLGVQLASWTKGAPVTHPDRVHMTDSLTTGSLIVWGRCDV